MSKRAALVLHDTDWSNRQARIARSLLFILTSIPVAGILATLVISICWPHAAVRSGDAMLDRLAAGLAEPGPQGAVWQNSIGPGGDGRLPWGEIPGIGAWERELGADPRYWLVLARYGPQPKPIEASHYQMTGEQSINLDRLEAAHAKGKLNVTGLAVLQGQYEDAWAGQLKEQEIPKSNSRMNQTEQDKLIKRAFRLHNAELESLIRDMQRSEPPQAYPWYAEAELAWACNDGPGALRAVERGNAIPLYLEGRMEPETSALKAVQQGRMLADSEIFTALCHQQYSFIGWYTVPDNWSMLFQLADQLEQSGDYAGLAAMHRLACRCDRESISNSVNAGDTLLCRDLFNTAVNTRRNFTPSQRQALKRLARLVKQVETLALSQYQYGTLGNPYQHTGLYESIVQFCDGGRSQYIKSLRDEAAGWVQWEQVRSQKIDPLFDEIERFDYVTLSFK
jgi:hypothetical protein